MIVIGKKSIHYEYYDSGLKVMVNILSSDVSIVRYMDDFVFLEEGVTVGDIFDILAAYEEDIDFAFDSSLGGYPFALYLNEIEEKLVPDENLVFAEFVHETSLGDNLVINPRFGAVGLDPDNKNMIPYSVELCPIASYKHLEVRLNTALRIFKKEEGDEEDKILLETMKMFTLYDIIHALLYEVSYHGTPTIRKTIMDELTDAVFSNKNAVPSGSEVIVKKDEEISKLKAELEESVKDEDYERSAKIRDKIAMLDKDRNKQ